MEKNAAIIDLGSNSVRLLIMRLYRDGSYKVIDQAKEMVRLGENMGAERILKPAAIKRTINALRLFRRITEAHSVQTTCAVATAAVRSAANQAEFLQAAREQTGFDIRVITGEEEADYDYVAVINTITIDDCIITDIGGASTEIVLVKNRLVQKRVSLPIGAVSLTERFPGNGEYSSEQLLELKSYITGLLDEIAWLTQANGLPVVGLGGTIRTVAKIDKKKKGYPLDSLHNYRLTGDEVSQIENEVVSASLTDRINIPGLDKERADIFPAGVSLINTLLAKTCSKTVYISGNGLREGVFFKHFLSSADHEQGIVRDVLQHSVNNILCNYEMNIRHCRHVEKLALALFDQTRELHGMDHTDRKILSVGALLHDIGVYINYYNHHRHGFYLALNSRISGLTNKEMVMCAFIVAMHTNEDLKQHWGQYNMLLDKSDYKKIKKLSLFVRIAEQLDRNEFGNVQDLKCQINDAVQIEIITKESPELEISEALKSCDHFEKLLKKKMRICWKN